MAQTTIRYRDHAITYDKDGMTLVPFVDRQTGEEAILVKCDESEDAAYYLEDLKPLQCLETSAPLDISRVFKNLDIAHPGSSYTRRYILIARIDSDPKDTLRAVYAGTEDKIPVFVASCSSDIFNELDVGSVLSLYSTSRPKVMRYVSQFEAKEMLHAMVEEKEERQAVQRRRLAAGKAAYVEDFLKGDIDTVFLDIFTITGNTFSYTDTDIVIDDDERREKALRMLATRRPNQSVDVQLNQATTEHDDWYGFDQIFFEIVKAAESVRINGVEVAYEERYKLVERKDVEPVDVTSYYVNQKKISTPDVFTVISAASCYANRQQEYDEYVQQVSRVSLKFHRAVAAGVPLEDISVRARIERGDTEVTLPNDFADHEDEIAACRLPLRKEHGSKAEVFLLNKWRRILDFDGFVRVCQKRPRQYHEHSLFFPHGLEFTPEERHCCTRLAYIDARLHPDDWVFPESMLVLGGRDSYSRGSVSDTTESRQALKAAAAAYNTMFGDSLKKQYETLRRSKALFDRIISQEKVETINDGKNFIVTGASGRRYDVSIHDKVTDLQSNRHICIVNGGSRELGGWDYLSSLIAALAHDNRTAASVGTLHAAADEEADPYGLDGEEAVGT